MDNKQSTGAASVRHIDKQSVELDVVYVAETGLEGPISGGKYDRVDYSLYRENTTEQNAIAYGNMFRAAELTYNALKIAVERDMRRQSHPIKRFFFKPFFTPHHLKLALASIAIAEGRKP